MKTTSWLSILSLSLLACGEKAPAPGAKNSVTAYESDGSTVIKFEGCPKLGRSYDYPSCGKSLRESVAALMCARGKGTKTWHYQVGDGQRLPQTTVCK